MKYGAAPAASCWDHYPFQTSRETIASYTTMVTAKEAQFSGVTYCAARVF